eukprot:GHRQ01027426.1.p2 GENE.GHRQ01027426.1~~GHRQ01027426.1.p2  ORF type:complete len:103 (-),score=27.81 GHRQ01027426.1:163-471(-)
MLGQPDVTCTQLQHLRVFAVPQAQLLCKATYEGKLDRLSNLLRAGCQADAHDYDGQTALHVAAADSNLPAVGVAACCLCSIVWRCTRCGCTLLLGTANCACL